MKIFYKKKEMTAPILKFCVILCYLLVIMLCFNPLPHGLLAAFFLTAGGLPRPPEEDDISLSLIHI